MSVGVSDEIMWMGVKDEGERTGLYATRTHVNLLSNLRPSFDHLRSLHFCHR